MDMRMLTRLNERWGSWPAWARQLSVGLAYSIAYLCTLHLSLYHWFLPAGVRLLSVLMAPYRYWVTLLFCDSLAGIDAIIDCEYTFGVIWEGLMLVSPNLFIMPLVAWGRSKRWLSCPLRIDKSSTIIALILLMSMAALLTPLWVYFINHFRQVIPGGPSREEWLQRDILGHYLGMLTLVPIGLFIADLLTNRRSLNIAWAQHRQWFVEIVSNLVVVAGLCLAIRVINNQELGFMLRLGLLMPIIRAGFYYGWGGTALTGCLSSLAWASLEPDTYDPFTVHIEILIGFAMTSFLVLGARVSILDVVARHEKTESRRNLEAGRQLLGHAELRFQRVGSWMSDIADPALTLPLGIRPYLDHVLPPLESLTLQNQGVAGKLQVCRLGQDLASLPLKLDEAEAEPFQALKSLFEKEHIRFRGRLCGSLADFSPLAYQAICRLLADACAYLVSQPEMYVQLDLRVRRIDWHSKSVVAIRVRASRSPMIYDPAQREAQLKLMLQISSTGLELQGMAHLAKLYHGRVQHRRLDSGKAQCIQLFLEKDAELAGGDLFNDSDFN